MLGIHFLGKGHVSLDQMPTPEPSGQEVVVRIRAAGICGTDRTNLEGSGQATVPGHENAGDVVAVDRPERLEVGSRVAINCHVTCRHCEHCLRGDLYFCDDLQVLGFDRDGGFAEYIRVPEACCIPLPDDISYDIGSLLIDQFGTPFRAVKRAGLFPGDQVAIWGAGPIGLGALIVASWLGARVAVVDGNEFRLTMAGALGAAILLNPFTQDPAKTLLDWTSGRGLDAAVECVGSEKASLEAISALKRRGRLVVVGVSHKLTLDPEAQLINRELTIMGSRNSNTAEFDEMVAVVRRGAPAAGVVTHRFPIARAEEAFAVFRSARCGKVLLTS